MPTSPATFLKQTRDELKKVVWPGRQEVIRLTTVVILISLIVGFFLGGLDFVFTKIMEVVVK
ncbi:MAG: preprotein translocase subunit SecE [Patescibacteria group bacterium]